MISNPKNGWCDFKLGNFTGGPSYLADVPVILLDAFIDYQEKGVGMAWFDEEGTEFTLVINPYSIFVIEERDTTPVLHSFPSESPEVLAEKLISDIESNLQSWVEFLPGDDQDDIKLHEATIKEKIETLKKLLKEYPCYYQKSESSNERQ